MCSAHWSLRCSRKRRAVNEDKDGSLGRRHEAKWAAYEGLDQLDLKEPFAAILLQAASRSKWCLCQRRSLPVAQRLVITARSNGKVTWTGNIFKPANRFAPTLSA